MRHHNGNSRSNDPEFTATGITMRAKYKHMIKIIAAEHEKQMSEVLDDILAQFFEKTTR